MMNWIVTLLACGPLLCVSLANAAEPQCYTNQRYHVAANPLPDEAGNTFAVTRLDGGTAPAACAFDDKADLVIGTAGEPLWFGELADDSLILSRSTGPQGDLVVYDLASGNAILDVPSDEFERQGNRLTFWQRMAQATADNCPDFAENTANGFGSVTAVEKVLDLATRAVSETGKSKCVPVQ
jgi:hypothetical protein